MSANKISCLHAITSPDSTIQYISLEEKTVLTLGRGAANDVCLNKSPFISRQHAKLIKDGSHWSVVDLNSGNGVFVNEEKIVPSVPKEFRDRDILELGKDPKTGLADYSFRYYKAAYIKSGGKARVVQTDVRFVPPPLKRLRDKDHAPSPTALRRQLAEEERIMREKMAEKERILEEKRQQMEHKQCELENRLREMADALAIKEEKQLQLQGEVELHMQQLSEKEAQLAKEREEKLAVIKQKEAEAENRIKELQQELNDKEKKSSEEFNAVLEEKAQIGQLLEQQKKEREHVEEQEKLQQKEFEEIKRNLESAVSNMNAQLCEKEKSEEELSQHVRMLQSKQELLETELEKEKIRLEEDKHKLVVDMENRLQTELEMQKRALKSELNAQISVLEDEKSTIESRLHEETKQKEEENKMVVELRKQQEDLNQKLKSLEQEKHKIDLMEDVMEEELVCTICSELFVKAMSLSCSHSFCYYCIVEWMLRKTECPNCRMEITSCVPCIVLDNTIDRMIEHMSDETKQRRRVMAEDRKGEQETLENKLKKLPDGKRNNINRLLNKRSTGEAAKGSASNPIVLTEILPAGLQNILVNYLSPERMAQVRGQGEQNARVARVAQAAPRNPGAQPVRQSAMRNPFTVAAHQAQGGTRQARGGGGAYQARGGGGGHQGRGGGHQGWGGGQQGRGGGSGQAGWRTWNWWQGGQSNRRN